MSFDVLLHIKHFQTMTTPVLPPAKMLLADMRPVLFVRRELERTLHTLICMMRSLFLHMFMQDFVDLEDFATMNAHVWPGGE